MKLKYYLRGLAVGIIASTIILLVTFSGNKSSLTDQQVMERAKKLGMVMSTQTSNTGEQIPQTTEKNKSSETNTQQKASEATTEKGQQTEQSTTEQTTASTELDTGTTTSSENNSQSTETKDVEAPSTTPSSETTQNQASVSIQINAGDSSDQVAKTLYDAGLIDSAQKFNSYMVKQGYDRKLKTGNYSVEKGMSYDQIMSRLLKK